LGRNIRVYCAGGDVSHKVEKPERFARLRWPPKVGVSIAAKIAPAAAKTALKAIRTPQPVLEIPIALTRARFAKHAMQFKTISEAAAPTSWASGRWGFEIGAALFLSRGGMREDLILYCNDLNYVTRV